MDQQESLIAQAYRNRSAYLDLSYMGLKDLSPDIGKLEDLVDLDLRGNILDCLPDEISRLHRLAGLHLDGNVFQKFPSVLFDLASLERITLSNNKLANLPRELGDMKDLVSVDISSNSFERLPAALWRLEKLARLDASDNEIERIPSSINALTNLVYLDLSRNKINGIPTSIGSLGRLRFLDVSDNLISELPGRLFRLDNLTYLDVCENDLPEIPVGLVKMPSLVYAGISGNDYYGDETFYDNITLEFVDLFEAGAVDCDGLDTREVPIFFLWWALRFREDTLADEKRDLRYLVQGTIDLLRFWAVDMGSGKHRWILEEQEYGLTGPGRAGYVFTFHGGILGQNIMERGSPIDGLKSFPIDDVPDPVARILVPNEECVLSYGCDLAQMWMMYHFDGIIVERADGRSLSDQNLKDIEQQISADIYADFDEEDDDELRLEFRAYSNTSLSVDFQRQ